MGVPYGPHELLSELLESDFPRRLVEVLQFLGYGLVVQRRGFGVGLRRHKREGVFLSEVLADGATLVESEPFGRGYHGYFAPWMTFHVFFGLRTLVLASTRTKRRRQGIKCLMGEKKV